MTEVACKAWRLCKVSTEGRVCRSVTEGLKCAWISRQRPCVYTRVTEVKCSYKPKRVLVVKSCVELLRSCGLNNLVLRHPCVLIRLQTIPTT